MMRCAQRRASNQQLNIGSKPKRERAVNQGP
jgi:hypothetical protein